MTFCSSASCDTVNASPVPTVASVTNVASISSIFAGMLATHSGGKDGWYVSSPTRPASIFAMRSDTDDVSAAIAAATS
eukprot:2703145-Pyramimonas_sp.AAC.1